MTKENWITIATIIIASITAIIAPLLNTWLQHRLTLARERQTEHQLKNNTGRKSRAYRFIKVVMFSFGIVAPLILLGLLLTSSEPTNRLSSFYIALCVALISFTIIILFIASITLQLIESLQINKVIPKGTNHKGALETSDSESATKTQGKELGAKDDA